MIIYHFCRAKDMRGIRSDGITKGAIPYHEMISQGAGRRAQYTLVLLPGWQWLTLDPDREHQSWNTHHLLLYDRTEYRWTVEIPDGKAAQLLDRDALAAVYPGTEALFDGWMGSESWRVYHGPIPRAWLKKLEHWDGAGWVDTGVR